MKFFNKDKTSAFTDKAAQGVSAGILKLQRRFADAMQRWSGSWNTKAKMVFLAGVSLVFATLSVLAILSPFSKTEKVAPPAAIKVISPAPVEYTPRITEEEFQRVQKFKNALDSATIKMRPGLMDSIKMVEESYYSNNK